MTEVRALMARVAQATADAQGQRAATRTALERLSKEQELARQLAGPFQAFGEDFVALYWELQERTIALTQLERAAGTRPEHALVLAKSIVEDARSAGLSSGIAEMLKRDVARWVLDAYFAA
jgi:hypothetical protein